MRAIGKRLCRLENGLGLGPGTERKLWVVTIVGRQLALDEDTCLRILRECGFLPTKRFGVVSLGNIPDGLNAKETESFLRKNGAKCAGPNDEAYHQA
jgi:hypothetical protein